MSGLSWIDWSIIGAYGVGMLVLGSYFARRQATTEEYYVGGFRKAVYDQPVISPQREVPCGHERHFGPPLNIGLARARTEQARSI